MRICIEQNMIGGPSIIFRRHHKVGETHLRNTDGKVCRAIIGKDANVLCLQSLSEQMPPGSYSRVYLN